MLTDTGLDVSLNLHLVRVLVRNWIANFIIYAIHILASILIVLGMPKTHDVPGDAGVIVPPNQVYATDFITITDGDSVQETLYLAKPGYDLFIVLFLIEILPLMPSVLGIFHEYRITYDTQCALYKDGLFDSLCDECVSCSTTYMLQKSKRSTVELMLFVKLMAFSVALIFVACDDNHGTDVLPLVGITTVWCEALVFTFLSLCYMFYSFLLVYCIKKEESRTLFELIVAGGRCEYFLYMLFCSPGLASLIEAEAFIHECMIGFINDQRSSISDQLEHPNPQSGDRQVPEENCSGTSSTNSVPLLIDFPHPRQQQNEADEEGTTDHRDPDYFFNGTGDCPLCLGRATACVGERLRSVSSSTAPIQHV